MQVLLPGSDRTLVYCVNIDRVGVKICCTEIAGVASLILTPKSHFCQKWELRYCGAEPSICKVYSTKVIKSLKTDNLHSKKSKFLIAYYYLQ